METDSNLTLAALIGIDWGSAHHDVALQASGSSTIESCRIAHEPGVLAEWLAGLERRFGSQPIGIAIETSKGAVVHALLESAHVVLYPVNPRSLHRFREAFSPNGAKDDAPDAKLLLSLLVKHRDQLKPLVPHDTATKRLQQLTFNRRTLVNWRTQLTLQLQAALGAYFPLALTVTGEELYAPLACDFLRRWSTLEALQRARSTTLRQFYRDHNCRKAALIDERLTRIQQATPLTRDPGIIEPAALLVRALVQQLQPLAASIQEIDQQIADAFAAHPDAALFASLPGAGPAFAPRLLAAFGTDRTRYPTASDMQKAAGIAPVTIRSGKRTSVHWRWATSTFVRQTFHEFAQYSIRHAPWASAFYHRQRQRGHTHHATLRSLAFKWIRIIWRCWQDSTTYDDARYLRALDDRGSPLMTQLRASATTP